MNKWLKVFIGMLSIFPLTGCFGEDYDVGVPTAHLQVQTGLQSQQTQLTEANISWSSSSGDVEETIDDIEEFGLAQEEIKVSPKQDASLEFEENEENGGDIWTDPTITASLWKNGESIDIELNDYNNFQFPTTEGNYVLEVNFIDSENSAQFVGNIVIENASEQMITDGQLPAFTLMEMPSIKKVKSPEADGVLFAYEYTEVCWNNCGEDNLYKFPAIHAGDVEIGDKIQMDWHKMNPQPTDINLLQIDTQNFAVITKESIDTSHTPFELELDEEKMGAQYAIEFLWKEGTRIKGRSMLNFRVE